MSFGNREEKGRPVTIKDEGLTLVNNVASIDFAGAGVTGSSIGDLVTENIPGSNLSGYLQNNIGIAGGTTLIGGTAQTELLNLKANSATASGTNIAGGEVNLYATPGTGTGVSGFHFFTGTTLTTGSTLQTSSEKMTILGNGNVGIGTTSPLTKLHIKDGTNINLKFGASGSDFQIKATNDADSAYTSLLMRASQFSLMNGNVGIGTTNPSYPLDISSNAAFLRFLGTLPSGSDEALGFINNSSNSGWTIGRRNTADTFEITYNTSTIIPTVRSGNLFTILSGGNVGIGTTVPTAVLHLKAGIATANTAPLKFTSGALNTTAEVGAVEFLTDNWYATITTGAARKAFVLDDGARLTSGKIPIATTNGRLIDLTPQAYEADLKTDYTTGYLDTEAEIIAAINATNTKINAIITKLETLGLLASS